MISIRYTIATLSLFTLGVACLHLKKNPPHYELKTTGNETELSLLTFNILATLDLSARQEGYPPWSKRKDKIFAYLEKLSTSLVVLQECTPGQLDEITGRFGTAYHIVAFPSETSDVMLMIDHSKFRILEAGYWKLDKVFKGIIRIAVWSKLEDKHTGKQLALVGTHLDAQSHQLEQAELLVKKVQASFAEKVPIFIAGDFNFGDTSQGFSKLITASWQDAIAAKLAFEPTAKAFTYPYKNPTRRIDHIFFKGSGISVLFWEVGYHLAKEKEILSDHLPVYAKFLIAKAP